MKLNGTNIAYKDATINDILDWCEQNGELEWLVNVVNTKTERTRYKKVPKTDENGVIVLGEDAKVEMVEDKSQPYKVMATPTALEIRKLFFTKYFPKELPKPKKKPTFAELVNAKAKAAGIAIPK